METEKDEVVEAQAQDLASHFIVADKDALFLKEHVAKGFLGDEGEPIEVYHNLKGGELLILYKDRYASIDMKSYIMAAANAIEKELENDNDDPSS